MILSLLLLAVDPETAVDAERAFNRAAQSGQWAAFRKFMADDAIVFTPQPEKARDALPTKEPPIAVQWWPAESYISCDGKVAVNTGPWVRPRSVGYFTTVWARQGNGHFKWVVDGGDTLARPLARPEQPRIHTASCTNAPTRPLSFIVEPAEKSGMGGSPDRTLGWIWPVSADGARTFIVKLWDGTAYRELLHQQIPAPK